MSLIIEETLHLLEQVIDGTFAEEEHSREDSEPMPLAAELDGLVAYVDKQPQMLAGDHGQFGVHTASDIVFQAAQMLGAFVQEVSEALEDALVVFPRLDDIADGIVDGS